MTARNTISAISILLFVMTGCATKNYVRQNIQPVDAKVDTVNAKADKINTDLDATRKDVDKNTTDISAVGETAKSADSRASDALTKANQVDQKADQNTRGIDSLKSTIANLDDYKVVKQATVLFGFNRATLTPDDKQQLDQLVSNTSSLKRYFIAVEGYTDQTGSADYNLELSKRRADAVVQYLAGQRDVDFNRIHTIGFGDQKPADTGKSRDDRAKNRRVEVKIYSADQALSQISQR